MNGITSVAMGKVRLAIERLANKYPLHAGILARWRIEESSVTDTMAVGFLDETLRLLYSPNFVESITLDELGGVLLHEANHVLFEHVYHNPPPTEDGLARTTAEELCANEWIGEPLPAGAIQIQDFPSLPENEDTVTRYKRLAKANKKRFRHGQGTVSLAKCKSHSSNNGVLTVDDHSTWIEISGNAVQAKAAAAIDIATAWDDLNDNQKTDIPQPIADAAKKAAQGIGVNMGDGAGRGDGAGSSTETLTGGTAHIPWQTVLRRQVHRAIERRPVFGRIPRRFPDLAGVIPGKGRIPGKPVVIAIIDTSGSMSNECLSNIAAELEIMARRVNIIVVECDTEIHVTYGYRGAIRQVHGRGGTDLTPAFDQKIIHEHRPSLIVVFTDGDARVPDKRPPVPVLWCLTPRGRKPTTWGDEIHMLDQETHMKYRESIVLYRNSAPKTRFNISKPGTEPQKSGPQDSRTGVKQ